MERLPQKPSQQSKYFDVLSVMSLCAAWMPPRMWGRNYSVFRSSSDPSFFRPSHDWTLLFTTGDPLVSGKWPDILIWNNYDQKANKSGFNLKCPEEVVLPWPGAAQEGSRVVTILRAPGNFLFWGAPGLQPKKKFNCFPQICYKILF